MLRVSSSPSICELLGIENPPSAFGSEGCLRVTAKGENCKLADMIQDEKICVIVFFDNHTPDKNLDFQSINAAGEAL